MSLKSILFLTLYFSPFVLQANISEKNLGIEDSAELKQVLKEQLLTQDLKKIDQAKLSSYLSFVKQRRDDLLATETFTYTSLGKDEQKAAKEANKNVLLLVSDEIQRLLTLASSSTDTNQVQYLAKQALKLESSFVKEGRYSMLLEVIGGLKVVFLEKHEVPLNEEARQWPSNLVHPKQVRYALKSELAELASKGIDISLLDPPDSSFWSKPQTISGVDILAAEKASQLPKIFYYKKVKLSDHHPKLNVYSLNEKGKKIDWKLKIGNEVNAEVVSMRLMQLVGMKYDKMNFVKGPRVYFKNRQERNEMIHDWVSFYTSATELPHKLIAGEGEDSTGYYVDFFEGCVEGRPDGEERVGSFKLNTLGAYERREVRAQLLFQGLIASGDIKEAHNNKIKMVKNTQGEWEVEELIHDIGKALGTTFQGNMINRFQWHWIDVKRGNIKFDYARYHIINDGDTSKNPFMVAHISDIKWAARYLAAITQKQIEDIFTVAGFVRPVANLYVQKMITRRNDVIRALNLEGQKDAEGKVIKLWDEVDPGSYSVSYNREEVVQNGKLMRDFIEEGYPISYAATGKTLKTISTFVTPVLFDLLSSIELDSRYLPVNYPNQWVTEGNTFTRTIYAGLVSIILHRSFDSNLNRDRLEDVYKVTDVFEARLNVGGKLKGLLGPAEIEFKSKFFVGQRWSQTWMARDTKMAATQNWDKLFKLPFNWKSRVSNLITGDAISTAKIMGIDSRADAMFGIPSLIGIGPGIDTNQIITHQVSFMQNKDGVEIAIDRGPNSSLDISILTKYLSLLRLKHATLGIYGGKSTHYTQKLSSLQNLNWDEVMGLWNDLNVDDEIQSLEANQTLTESRTKGSFSQVSIPGMSRKSSRQSEKGVRYLPDHVEEYFIHAQSEREKTSSILAATTHTEIEVTSSVQDFSKATKAMATMTWEIDDPACNNLEFIKAITTANQLVGEQQFIFFRPGDYNKDRFGEIVAKVQIEFGTKVIECLVDARECQTKGQIAARQKLPKLEEIDDRSDLRQWSSAMTKMMNRSPEVFGKAIKALGDEARVEVIFSGEFLQTEEQMIMRSRGSEVVL